MGVKGKLKSWNGHVVVGGAAKCWQNVGMVKTYSKSAHVNDPGFAWTGHPSCCMDRLPPPPPPPSLHRPAFLLVPTGFLPGGFTLQVHTAPSLHLPLFLEESFYTPLFLYFLWNANYSWASQRLRLSNNSDNKERSLNHGRVHSTIAQCGLCLGGQPRVGCGRWVKDILQLPMFG